VSHSTHYRSFWRRFYGSDDPTNSVTALKGRRSSSSFLACNCLAPYVDIILHRGRFWDKSAALGRVRWCFRSCWTVLSHMMRGRPSCLLQSARGEARVSRHDWIIVVSMGCFVSLRTSFRTNWYHLMPSSIRRHHWSSASILHASVSAQQWVVGSQPNRPSYLCASVLRHKV